MNPASPTGSFARVASDRADHADALIVAGPIVEMRFRHGQRALGLRAGKAFHLLVKAAGNRLIEDTEHSIRLAELRNVAHLSAEEIVEAVRELQTTLVEVVIERPGETGRPPQRIMKSGPLLADAERNLDAAGFLRFKFSDAARWVMANAATWTLLSRRIVLAFQSRYALRLFEIASLRAGLRHKTVETFALDDLRLRLGVMEGTLPRWQDLKRRVLEPALAEINHLSDIAAAYEPVKDGKAVVGVKLSWRAKDGAGRKAAAVERGRHSAGRRARREGRVEHIVEGVDGANERPATTTPTKRTPAVKARRVFPADGGISFGPWAELVRQHAPTPTPDVDRVADAFRKWAASKGLALDATGVEKAFAGFCRQYRVR